MRSPRSAPTRSRALLVSALLAAFAAGCGGESDPTSSGAEPLDAAFSLQLGPTYDNLGGPYGPAEIYVIPQGEAYAVPVTSFDEISQRDGGAVWSPDRTRLALEDYGRGVEIVSLDAGGHVRKKLVPSDTVQWSPDGEHLLFDSSGGLVVGDANGEHGVTVGPTGSSAAWSPNGERIAISRSTERNVLVTDVSGREILSIARDGYPVWSPDSERLFIARPAAGSLPTDGGVAVSLETGDAVEIPVHGAFRGWSADSAWLAFEEPRGDADASTRALVVASADGTSTEELVEAASVLFAWSPVEPVLAFSRIAGTVSLWSPSGVESTLLGAGAVSLVWSPDGSRVLATEPLAWVARDAVTEPIRTTGCRWYDDRTPFSSDGSHVLAISGVGLSVLDVEDGSEVRLASDYPESVVWLDDESVGIATPASLSKAPIDGGQSTIVWPRPVQPGHDPHFKY
ncbi:MAG TPA: hypothetical protein VF103_02740 [Polyangiaceae bacterium]